MSKEQQAKIEELKRVGYKTQLYTPDMWRAVGQDIADLEYFINGEKAWGAKYLKNFFDNPQHVTAIAFSPANQVSGIAYAEQLTLQNVPQDGVAYVEGVYVHPLHQRRGVAGLLLPTVEEQLRLQGYDSFTIDAAVHNGFAATLAKVYRERILAQGDPKGSTWGPQVNFKIKL